MFYLTAVFNQLLVHKIMAKNGTEIKVFLPDSIKTFTRNISARATTVYSVCGF